MKNVIIEKHAKPRPTDKEIFNDAVRLILSLFRKKFPICSDVKSIIQKKESSIILSAKLEAEYSIERDVKIK